MAHDDDDQELLDDAQHDEEGLGPDAVQELLEPPLHLPVNTN